MRSQEYNYFIVILWLCMFMSSSIYGQKLVVRQQQTRVKNKPVFKSHTKKNWISLSAFHDGLALAMNRNYKYGFLDKTGKMVMTKRYNCDSSSTIKAKRSKYDHNDMNDLFPSAIDHCISSFVSDIVVNDIGQEMIDSAAKDMELYGEEGTTITLPSAKPESDNTEAE